MYVYLKQEPPVSKKNTSKISSDKIKGPSEEIKLTGDIEQLHQEKKLLEEDILKLKQQHSRMYNGMIINIHIIHM